MLKILLFTLFAVVFVEARISKLSEAVVFKIDEQPLKFEKKCTLVVNTASQAVKAEKNMEYLNSLVENVPDLEIVAVPIRSFEEENKTKEELSKWFFDEWDAKYTVLEPVGNTNESEILDFLSSKAGSVRGAFNKFIVEKDGKTVKKYGPQEIGPFSKGLDDHLIRCAEAEAPEEESLEQEEKEVEEEEEKEEEEEQQIVEIPKEENLENLNAKILKLTDFKGQILGGKNLNFEKYRDQCTLVVYSNFGVNYKILEKNFRHLLSLKESFPELNIVFLPEMKYPGDDDSDFKLERFFRYYLNQNINKFDIVRPIDELVNGKELYKFLMIQANKNSKDKFEKVRPYTRFLVDRDSSTVTKFERENLSLIRLPTGLKNEIRNCLTIKNH